MAISQGSVAVERCDRHLSNRLSRQVTQWRIQSKMLGVDHSGFND